MGDGDRWIVNGRFLASRATGLQRVARSLLAAALAAGLDAEVVAPSGVDDPLVDRHLRAAAGRAGHHLWEQVALPAAAGRRPVLSLVNTAPVLARRGTVMVHDLAARVDPRWFRPAMQAYLRASIAAARRAETVLTVSQQVAGELVEVGVDPGRIHVVRNAVDPRFAPAPPSEVDRVRAAYRLDRPYAVHVGWSDPRKNVATAVAAHRLVVGDSPHDLVLVGGTHVNFAEVVPPPDPTVRAVGYVPDADLVPLLTGAAVFLYPSWYEGFGLPPVEAVSCRTAAVASDLPALHEAAGDAVAYAPPGDVGRWALLLREALAGQLVAGDPPRWTWDDAAGVLLDAISAPRRR